MKLFEKANDFCRESDWTVFALVKICLFSIGAVVGLSLPRKNKPVFYGIFGATFLLTYIPLMYRFIRSLTKSKLEDEPQVD